MRSSTWTEKSKRKTFRTILPATSFALACSKPAPNLAQLMNTRIFTRREPANVCVGISHSTQAKIYAAVCPKIR